MTLFHLQEHSVRYTMTWLYASGSLLALRVVGVSHLTVQS